MKNQQEVEFNKIFDYLENLIAWRIENPTTDFDTDAPKLDLKKLGKSKLGIFLKEENFSQAEIVILLLALAPSFSPAMLVDAVTKEFPSGADFVQFGGVKGQTHRGILPTGETAQFIIGGANFTKRIECVAYFSGTHFFNKKDILYLEKVSLAEPLMSGKLILFPDIIYKITTGKVPPPKLSTQFPAEKLETQLDWNDLILSEKTMQQIKELEMWLQHNEHLFKNWRMEKRLKAGYRVLFHGPAGTGKTLTASLLGKYTQKPVYRIDLSTVVSKYIGETEKNLSNLFNKAAHKDWILFFDEADAIFGKRTNVRDAHDKYANQEVSYLLQRVESYSGLIILASNFRDNIDEAFTRRFQSIIAFEMPGSKERSIIWKTNLPQKLKIDPQIDWEEVAKKYELTGSNILNIIHFCCLKVLSEKSEILTSEILLHGIKREFLKENRTH
ncbi:ATP-binding protein [Aequorivita sp. CIP111184]|uniref:ATP-binding protein n=1 Tax=Aequorivita sp. CIP111184 TaxID=2211356 RepID=UPI000DBBB705|nr:ATP-binding protein [Aequorivita sp. CIP111184]SRX54971.1 ATP-dependent zinc metalloprotease FtsH 2 [Aequorivita sp. CIP111184]